MANKYIRPGALVDGDGTASNVAATPGGAGAWNSLSVFEGGTPAFGSLAAGDTVYIRSLNEDGTAITRTLTAAVTLGSAAATTDSPITWVIDDGHVWPGISGVVTYDMTTTQYAVTFRQYNCFIAEKADGLVVKNPNTAGSDSYLVSIAGNVTNVMYDTTGKTASTTYSNPVELRGGIVVRNFHYKTYKPGTPNITRGMFNHGAANGNVLLINPKVTIMNPVTNGIAVFFVHMSYSIPFDVIGGSIEGAGATSNQPLIQLDSASAISGRHWFRAIGLKYPNAMNVVKPGQEPVAACSFIDIIGCDGGSGAHYERGWGYATSRSDNYPPTLNAQLPDSAGTPWSWKLYSRNASRWFPATLDFAAYYQGASAAKTITLELLVESTTWAVAAHKGNTWIEVFYTDSGGVTRSETTFDQFATAALTDSTAAWSATTWGTSSFVKKKIALTTQNAVKQDTMVAVKFCTFAKAANTSQVFFICPDFQIT